MKTYAYFALLLIKLVVADYTISSWHSTLNIVGGTQCTVTVSETITLNFTGTPVYNFKRILYNKYSYKSPILVTGETAFSSLTSLLISKPFITSNSANTFLDVAYTNTSTFNVAILTMQYTVDGPLIGNVAGKTNDLTWTYDSSVPINNVMYILQFPTTWNLDASLISVSAPNAKITSQSIVVTSEADILPNSSLHIKSRIPQQIFSCYAVDPSNTSTIIIIVVVVVVCASAAVLVLAVVVFLILRRKRKVLLFGPKNESKFETST